MEFWGVEVKAGKPFKIVPEPGKLIHISQAALGEVKDVKGAKHVHIRLNVGTNKSLLGILSADDRPQLMFDLVFEREFELSHDWKSGSVYFIGYTCYDIDDNDISDSDSDEDFPIIAANNDDKAKVKNVKPEKDEAIAIKTEDKEDEASESDEDESDDDLDDSGSEDADGLALEFDSAEEMDSDESSDEEEAPKQPKKRSSSALETPLPAKKAKLATPGKIGNKSSHTGTPYPLKKGGKTPGGNKRK